MRSRIGGLLLLLGLACDLSTAHAQRPGRLPGRPARPDTAAARRDTLPPDSARAAAPDTTLERLLKLEGYTPVEYKADSAEFRTRIGELRLIGSAEVVRGGDRLTADSIVYSERTQDIAAFGQPKITGQQAADITGDILFYNLETRRASVEGGRTQFTEGATWYVYDSNVTAEGRSHFYVSGGKFTSCDLEDPHFHFQSDKIMVIRDRLIVARPARLYFADVPVLWIPFVVQDLSKGRRSGVLTPRFGVNDIVRTGQGRRIENVGYYWAINDYMGAELSGTWDSRAYTALTGGLQYNWRRQMLNGNLSYSQYWQETGGSQLSLNTSNSWRPDERTSVSVQGQYTSSPQFVRSVSLDPREATRTLGSSASLNRRFDWGSLALQGRHTQSIADGRQETVLPDVSLSFNPITLFRSSASEPSWYNNATLVFGGAGSRVITDEPSDSVRDKALSRFNVNQSLTIGNLGLSTSAALNRELLRPLIGLGFPGDSLLPRIRDAGSWNASISYQQRLIGSTTITPNLGLSQEILRDDGRTGQRVAGVNVVDRLRGRFGANPADSLDIGEYVAAPVRLNFGAGTNFDVFGFFPGVGPFSRIRHHLKPAFNYTFSPAVEQTAAQAAVFGPSGSRTQSRLSLSLNQTFDAKLREARTAPPVDTLADTTAVARARAQPPADPEKVMLLSVSTTPLEIDFANAAEGGSLLTTTQISNTIRSDYLRGLNFTVSHDLFDRSASTRPGELGRFAPFLAALNTSFAFGSGSSLFRFLGLGQQEENPASPPAGGLVPGPDDADDQPQGGPGGYTGNPQPVGGGPWNVSLSYSLLRSRPDPFNRPGIGFGRDVQTVNANVSFSPTTKWAVDWQTSYSLSDGRFSDHYLRLRRDLHEWQANFDVTRTITGNTSFRFYVDLIANRDLKFEFRESNIGGQRR